VTPTPTATLEITPTPTPTITPSSGYYYYVVQFDCTGGIVNPRCVANSNTGYAFSSTALTVGNYYNVGASYVWYIVNEVGFTTFDIDLTGAIGYDVCTDACTF
jgi:hypothetical protein